MEWLQPPAVLHEFRRQPVEQLRVTGPLAILSKIVRRLHQANAKMMLPQTIDDDSRSERMVGVCEPPCQLRPWVGTVRRQFGEALLDQHAQRSWRHSLAFLLPLAAFQHVNLGSLRGVILNGWDRRGIRRHFGFQCLDLLGQFRPLLAPVRQDLVQQRVEALAVVVLLQMA